MSNKTNVFYAVTGRNGAGVFNSWHYAECSRKYLRGYQLKRFDSREEASDYVWDHLSDILPIDVQVPEKFKLNRLEFMQELIAKSRGGSL